MGSDHAESCMTQIWLDRALLEECTDADVSALSQMQAKLEYVGIDALQNHIGKKVGLI